MTRSRLVALVPVLVALALAACGAQSGDPQAAGYFPTYSRGIDQDIAASHDTGVPIGSNLGLRDTQPWQVSRQPLGR